MKRAPSLTRRLIFDLSYTQLAAIVVVWFAVSVLGGFGIIGADEYWLDEFHGYYRLRDALAASLRRGADGALRIEPNEQLRAEIARSPGLRFAAFESMRLPAVPGSSPDLAAALSNVATIELRGVDFYFVCDSGQKISASAWRWKTPVGRMYLATGGAAFHWADFFYGFRNDFVSQSLYLGGVFSVSAVVAWLAVRRSLAPLRRAAEAAERIDLDSLGQGIRIDDAPIEVLPLVEAVNRALARLDASVARMRRYTANAAHELRTPVAILRARLENPEERGFRVDLQRDVRRIQAIIEQMLVTARLTEGQTLCDQEVDLCAAVRGIVADYSPLIYKAGRRIELECPPAPVRLRSNRMAIECVVANLVDNALRAEPEGGVVTVRVGADGVVSVADHGEGVAEGDRELVFEPFWRRSDAAPGTGLGLAIVRELVDRLGGRVWVERTPGGGATFSLAFSCVATAPS